MMQVGGITSTGALGGFAPAGGVLGGGGGLAGRQEGFASVMARASAPAGRTAEESAREAAEQFVAITLVQPLLADLRRTNGAAPPFAPSAGEKQFQQLMDAQIAQQVVKAAQFPLVERLARQLLNDPGLAAGAGIGRAR